MSSRMVKTCAGPKLDKSRKKSIMSGGDVVLFVLLLDEALEAALNEFEAVDMVVGIALTFQYLSSSRRGSNSSISRLN